MRLLENIVLTESIEIKATPERVFGFLLQIVDDASYRAWHPEDHVAFRWVKGEPWQKGSILYAEEYLHGKLHKLKFLITEVVPNHKIEFVPLSRLLRIYCPGNMFLIKPKENSCIFTTSGQLRIGWLVKTLAGKKLEHAISCVRKHMKGEGENMKRILDSENLHNQAVEATS
jgi:hypothetical protein